MQDQQPQLLPLLEAHRLAGLDAGPAALYPYYEGFSLANLPASVCHWLGIPEFGQSALDARILDGLSQSFRHVILLVVDGMGLNTLQATLERAAREPAFAVWADLASTGRLAPLTSIAPSTTAAALTTLWTGVPPGQHGVVGFEVWLKEYGMIANMIYHNPASFRGELGSLRHSGFDSATFLPVPTFGPHLARHGVRATAFQHRSIANSGLSSMLMPAVEVRPYHSLGDLWISLGDLLDERAGQPSYTYIYWGDLDEHSHRFGPADPRVDLEFTTFSQRLGDFVRRLRARSREDTLLIITADHGHIATPPQASYEIRRHAALMDCLVMAPSGEARLPFVYLRPGQQERFLSLVEETWPGQFLSAPSDAVVRAGLFGAGRLYARLPERVGDLVIFPQESAYWWFSERENLLLGRHGGLSRTEMLIPFFASVV